MKSRLQRAGHFLYRNRGAIAKGCLFLAGMIRALDTPLSPRPRTLKVRPPRKNEPR